MSVRKQSQGQIANHPAYTPSGGSHLMLHRAVVASTSLLAMAAALGWSDPALATGTCGVPSGSGLVNCAGTFYPGGIEYTAGDQVDDLTVNVGTYAGTSGAVTIGGQGILLHDEAGGPSSQTANIGKNVTIYAGAGYDAIEVLGQSFGYGASVSVTNKAKAVSATNYGIYALASSVESRNASATVTLSNSGYAVGDGGALSAGAYAHGYYSATTSTTIANKGNLFSYGTALTVRNNSYAQTSGHNVTSTATAIVTNKATADSVSSYGISIRNGSYAYADHYDNAKSTASSTLTNTGKVTGGYSAHGYTGIYVHTIARSGRLNSYHGSYLAEKARATASSTIVNSGRIVTSNYGLGIAAETYADSYGAKSATSSATTSIGNSGKIAVTGDDTPGVTGLAEAIARGYYGASAKASASSALTNSGSVSSTGIEAPAVYGHSYAYAITLGSGAVTASSTASVDNSGKLATTGTDAAGAVSRSVSKDLAFGAGNASAASTTSLTNSGAVSSDGTHASALNAFNKATAYAVGTGKASATGAASVTNSGAIGTVGYDSMGILSETSSTSIAANGNASSHTSTALTNSGAVKTAGSGAAGLYSTAASNSYAYDYAAAKSVNNITNSGAITTTGAPIPLGLGAYQRANAIYAYASSRAIGTNNGGRATASLNIANTGALSTAGDLTAGIYAKAFAIGETGGAYITVTNGGAITTKGAEAAAISAETTGVGEGAKAYGYSVASVTNSGAIKTAGLASGGISVKAEGATYGTYASTYASANVANAGKIATKGAYAIGIYALAGDTAKGVSSAPYANANVVNSGDVTTKGVSAAGVVAVSHAYSGYRYVQSAAHTNVTNTGAIATSGAGAAGIYALSQSYAASAATLAGDYTGKTYAGTQATSTGSIATKGDGAVGIAAVSQAKSYSIHRSRAVSASAVTNAGSIATTGAAAHGIASASYATAVSDKGAAYVKIAKATSTVTNAGSISVSGAGADGVLAYSFAYADTKKGGVASTTVANAGSVSATGKNEVGVFAASVAAGSAGAVGATATVINTGGTISASGKGGVGVEAEGAYATTITYAGSTITGGKGAKAMGVYETGAAALVYNGGSIGSANHHAVSLNGLYYSVLTNTGTVDGYVTIATTKASTPKIAGAVAFLNYGTWVAVGGNSTLSHVSGGASSNLVNEGSGTIVVVGNQTFTADTFTNIGFITMQQSATAGLGARPAFETLTVSGDFTGVGGTVGVDASTAGDVGDVLKVKGAVTGGTNIKATIVGTPGATTGNGILVAEAHSTTGASNFDLTGNTGPATPHTLVAGAFEYDLAFVPGSGTSGDWYLQSAGVYPGVYQFGQIGSSGVMVADVVNVPVDDLLSQVSNTTKRTALNDNSSMQVASMDDSFAPSPNGPGLSGWGRYEESRFNVDPSGSSFANYKLRVDTAQFGGDYDWHNAWNEVVVGGYVAPFRAWADFSNFGTHIGSSGTAYAVYGLWFNGGWEGGVRLNYDPTTAHISDTFLGTNAGFKTNEKGIQAAVRYNDMPLVDWADFSPSAELNYGTADNTHFTDGVGDLVNVGRTNDFWGKLNARFSTDVTTDRGLLVQPYANIGLLYRGDSSTKVSIGPFSSSTNINGWDGDFAAGVNTTLAANLSLSAEVDYLAGNRVEGWTGFLGLRYTP